MKKILFVILFGWSALLGAYNECITDIYFGNGVWNDYQGASAGRDKLEGVLIRDIYHGDYEAFKSHHFSDRGDPNLNKNVVLLAFNWTGSSPSDSLSFKTKIIDLIETFYQLKDSNQLDGYTLYEMLRAWLTQDPKAPLSDIMWDKIDDIVADYSRTIEGSNLIQMIEDYETISLKKSHRVLLVAHSQGNLFGNEVYDNLISWEQEYFKMVSVGTPANNVIGKSAPYTTLVCDKVINDNLIGGIPGHLPGNIDCTGEEKSDDGHQFVASYLSNHMSLSKIVSDISGSLEVLSQTPSQWQTDQEIDKGTCDYRITVKHRFDPSLEIGEKVYPFAPNQKLYAATNQKSGTVEYVKATCGGTAFTDEWADKKENECWMINNEPKEKIKIIYNKTYIFRIMAQINIIGTCNGSLQYPIHIHDYYPDRVELSIFQQYGDYNYGDKNIVNLSTSFIANDYSECVSTLKEQVVSIYNVAENIVNEESIKVDRYLRNKFPTATISYGEKNNYYLDHGCHHADIFPGQREDLGYQCIGGFTQKVYIKVFE